MQRVAIVLILACSTATAAEYVPQNVQTIAPLRSPAGVIPADRSAVLSRDGKSLLYIRLPTGADETDPTVRASLVLRNLATGKDRVLVLWNLRTDQPVARIPVDPGNAWLDDVRIAWTADGNHLYCPEPEPGGNEERWAAVAWDVRNGRPAGKIPDGEPIGPGPRSDTMYVLRERAEPPELVLHDAASNSMTSVAIDGRDVLDASASTIVFVKRAADGVNGELCVGDLVLKEK